VTDRIAVRPSAPSARPVVVRSIPERDSDNRERFTRITNPQIPAVQPRSARVGDDERNMGNRGVSQPNARIIQSPGNRSEGSPVIQENRRIDNPRSSGSRPGNEEGVRGGSMRVIPQTTEPSNRQNPPMQRNERTVPEQRVIPQRAPEVSPRSEPRQESNFSARRSDLNPRTERLPETRSAPATSVVPGSNDGGRSSRPPEMRNTPSYSAPPSNSGERRSNSGVMRVPDSGRSYSAPAPRPSAPPTSGSHASSAPAPSRESSGTKAASEGNSGRHKQ
jgi:hypothetical protein